MRDDKGKLKDWSKNQVLLLNDGFYSEILGFNFNRLTVCSNDELLTAMYEWHGGWAHQQTLDIVDCPSLRFIYFFSQFCRRCVGVWHVVIFIILKVFEIEMLKDQNVIVGGDRILQT